MRCAGRSKFSTERPARSRFRHSSRGWHGSRSTQRAGELGEDRQVGVQPDPLKPTDAERQQRPLVLEPPELALDGGAAPV